MVLQGIGNLIADRAFNTNTFKIDINSALHFVRSVAVEHEDLTSNALGLYSISNNVNEGKVKFLTPTGEGYITKARPAACAWDPIAGMTYEKAEVTLAAHNIQIEHCTEDIPGWEGVYGQSDDVEDLLASPVGQQFASDFIDITYSNIGNDLLKSAYFGKHPVVAQAKSSYTGSAAKFAAIEKTLGIVGGWLTMVDSFQTQGLPNYNVQINPNNVSGDKYTTSPVALFQDVIAAAPTKLKSLIASKKKRGQMPIILVSGGIFDAYKQHLIDTYPSIPDAYHFKLTAELCSRFGCIPDSIADDVLWYDGYWIKKQYIWDEVAADLQINHHRVLLTVPGNFGLGIDVTDIPGSKGYALRMDQSTNVKDAGKIYMSSNYKMGTALLMKDLCVNASLIQGNI